MDKKKDTLVNRTRYTSTFDNKLFEKFNELAVKTKINKTKLFDEALELLLEKYKDR